MLSRTINKRTGEQFRREISLVVGNQSLRNVWLEASKNLNQFKSKKVNVKIYAKYNWISRGGQPFVESIVFSSTSIQFQALDITISSPLKKRWKYRKEDIKEGNEILQEILDATYAKVRNISKLTKNPIEPKDFANKDLKKVIAKGVFGSLVELGRANQAREVSSKRRKLYLNFAKGLVSILDNTYIPNQPQNDNESLYFFRKGIITGKSLNQLQKYQLKLALADRHRIYGGNINSRFYPQNENIKYFQKNWNSTVFISGIMNGGFGRPQSRYYMAD